MNRGQLQDIRCDQCKTVLYRTDGRRVVARTPDAKWPLTIQPLVLTVGQRRRVLFCTKRCLLLWVAATNDTELRGGYPLW